MRPWNGMQGCALDCKGSRSGLQTGGWKHSSQAWQRAPVPAALPCRHGGAPPQLPPPSCVDPLGRPAAGHAPLCAGAAAGAERRHQPRDVCRCGTAPGIGTRPACTRQHRQSITAPALPAAAVFMQPHWDCALEPPAGVAPADVGIGQWQPGLSFGQTCERTMSACECGCASQHQGGCGWGIREAARGRAAGWQVGSEWAAQQGSPPLQPVDSAAVPGLPVCRLQGARGTCWGAGPGGPGAGSPGASSSSTQHAARARLCAAPAECLPWRPPGSSGAVLIATGQSHRLQEGAAEKWRHLVVKHACAHNGTWYK